MVEKTPRARPVNLTCGVWGTDASDATGTALTFSIAGVVTTVGTWE